MTTPSTPAVNQTILIVDDHPSFRKAARLALETDGYIVIGAVADGESAITETLRRQPDIVLLDVGLPDMTGFEAASRLRAADSSAAIVMTSSRERSQFGSLIVDSGADGYIQKEELSGEVIRKEIAAWCSPTAKSSACCGPISGVGYEDESRLPADPKRTAGPARGRSKKNTAAALAKSTSPPHHHRPQPRHLAQPTPPTIRRFGQQHRGTNLARSSQLG